MDKQEILALAKAAAAEGRTADKDRLMDMYFSQDAGPSDLPEGLKIIAEYEGGGRVTENPQGELSYRDSGYVQSDNEKVRQIMQLKGDAGLLVKGSLAQDMIGGAVVTAAASSLKGAPFARGYVEEAMSGLDPIMQKIREMFGGEAQAPVSADTIGSAIDLQAALNPKLTAASRLATGVSTGLALRAPNLITAPSRAGKISQGTLYGGGGGAVEGLVAGYGDGGAENAKREMTTGALFGAPLGAVAPLAGEAIGAGVDWFSQLPIKNVISQIGFKKDAAKVVRDAIEADAPVAAMNANTPYGAVGGLGPNMTNLLDVVANTPGQGASIVQKNLRETAAAASRDLNTRLDDVLGSPTSGKIGQKADIMKDTATARKEAYGSAYSVEVIPGDEASDAVLSLFQRVDPSDLSGATTLLREGGAEFNYVMPTRISEKKANELLKGASTSGINVRSTPDGYVAWRTPTIETLDYTTRRLHSRAQELKRSGDIEGYRSKTALAIQLRRGMDDVSPDYAKARAAGKDAIDQKIAADLGNDLLNPKVTREEVSIALDVMGPTELGQVRTALRNRLDEIAANARMSPTQDNTLEVVEALAQLRVMNSRAVATKMRMVLGDPGFDAISEKISQASQALTMSASIAQNSKTAIRQAVEARFKELIGTSMAETVGQAGLLPAVSRGATQAIIGGPNQAQRIQEVGRELAPVLSQRMTPEDLLLQAGRMEQAQPMIAAARDRRQLAQQNVTGGLLTAAAGGAQGAGLPDRNPLLEFMPGPR